MSLKKQKNLWVSPSVKTAFAKIRLFCLPYAGGSALIYRGWQNHFPDEIEICPVNLPGRGSRLGEAPYTDMMSLARALKDGLSPYFDLPFAFVGHSMGGTLSFELTRLLRRLGRPLPVKLFVGACGAPQKPSLEPPAYNLPDAELIEELRRLNGTPPEILSNRELLNILLPVVRADFSVCQTYRYVKESPLDIPITVMRGAEDKDIPEESAIAWQEQTAHDFLCYTLPGDHFFCHTERDQIIEIITRELLFYTGRAGF
jgi:medium-chain acyl-[acyl-carrier-protein] hydrolase